MANSRLAQYIEEKRNDPNFVGERVILEMTLRIAQLMEEKNVTKSELARRLNVSRSYITNLLDGSSNMTLKSIVKVFWVLGERFDFTHHPRVSLEQLSKEREDGKWKKYDFRDFEMTKNAEVSMTCKPLKEKDTFFKKADEELTQMIAKSWNTKLTGKKNPEMLCSEKNQEASFYGINTSA